jgi:hypothetical protein
MEGGAKIMGEGGRGAKIMGRARCRNNGEGGAKIMGRAVQK